MPDNANKGSNLVALINPADNRIYSVQASMASKYEDAGWAAPDAQPEVRRQEIDSALSSWKDYVPAVAMQVVRGVPFATTLLSKTVDEGTFKYLSQQSKAFEEEHGVLSAALSGAGGIASVAALSSGLGALGGALGIGAEAAGLGAEAATAGAEAAGSVAEGLGVGARAASVGADVATGAKTGASVAGDAPLTNALTRMGRDQFGEAGRVRDFIPNSPFNRSLVPIEGAADAGAGEAVGLGADVAATEPQALIKAQQWTRGDPIPPETVYTGRGSSLATRGETGLEKIYDLEVEPQTGLMRTDQLVPKGASTAESIIDAEFVDPQQLQLGAAPRVFNQGAGSAGRAAGLGAEAAGAEAGAAEAGAGLGADAAQAGAGAAADLGAEAGGVGAEAAGDATGLSLGARLSSLAPKGSLARTAAVAAAESAGYGAVYRIDNAAIEHALQPEGQEKLLFSANDILMDAALGAGIPVGLKGLGKLLGGTGKKIEGGALKLFQHAVMRGNALDAIEKQGRWGDLKETLHPLIGLSNERIATTLKVNRDLAGQSLQGIKDKYTGLTATALEKSAVLEALRPILGPDKTKTYKMTYAAFKQKNVSLDTIQKLADKIKRQVVWDADFKPGSNNQRIRDAYIEVVNLGSEMLERAQLPGVLDHLDWQMHNKTYSNNQLIFEGMKNKHGMDAADLLSRVGTAAMTGGALATLGVAGGAPAEAALRTGSWSILHHVSVSHIAPFAAKLGRGMMAADRRIGNALEAGLYGAAGQASKFTNPLRFDDAAATVALAASDPAKTIQNLQTVMDKQGIPQELSVPVVQKQVAGLTHLHNSRPVRNDAPDVVTDDQGDPVQNQRWLDQVHTFQDPAHGITYPTADNLRILKQFYPEVLYSAQQAALQQISKDPNLPIESKMWASQLLERPISNIASPTFAQTLAQARKSAAEAMQPKPAGGSSPTNRVQSSLSRADALQNRE